MAKSGAGASCVFAGNFAVTRIKRRGWSELLWREWETVGGM